MVERTQKKTDVVLIIIPTKVAPKEGPTSTVAEPGMLMGWVLPLGEGYIRPQPPGCKTKRFSDFAYLALIRRSGRLPYRTLGDLDASWSHPEDSCDEFELLSCLSWFFRKIQG